MKKSMCCMEQIATALRQVDAGIPVLELAPMQDQRNLILCLAKTLRPDDRGRNQAVAAARSGESHAQADRCNLTLDQGIWQKILAQKARRPCATAR